MKTKITHFILMITFIISAVHCSVDAGGMPLLVDRPLSLPPLLEEIPEPEAPEFHIYTEEEQQQVRQNLIGRYQSVDNNRISILEIRADNNVLEIVEEIRELYPYNIAFPVNGGPLLVIHEEGIEQEMTIRFSPNSHTEVIGLFGIENEIDIFGDLLGYFQKLPDHQEPVHNDL